MATTTEDLRNELRSRLPGLRERYHVSSLELFGSRLRGTNRPDSDLDLLVRFDATPTLFKLVAMENELSDALGVKVDLVLRDSLRPHIGERILREAVAI